MENIIDVRCVLYLFVFLAMHELKLYRQKEAKDTIKI